MLRIGIDLGGTKTEGIVINEAGKMLYCERRPTPQDRGYRAILKTIHALVLDLEKKAGQSCRVGIGTPGAISTRTGCLKNSNTVCLNGKPVKDDLEKILSRPIRLANDANCFALSEALDGAGQGAGVVFGVILGTGVGGGIVINGQLIEGLQHIAGEWGHNVLENRWPAVLLRQARSASKHCFPDPGSRATTRCMAEIRRSMRNRSSRTPHRATPGRRRRCNATSTVSDARCRR